MGMESEERRPILTAMSYKNPNNVVVYGKRIEHYCDNPDSKLKISFPHFFLSFYICFLFLSNAP